VGRRLAGDFVFHAVHALVGSVELSPKFVVDIELAVVLPAVLLEDQADFLLGVELGEVGEPLEVGKVAEVLDFSQFVQIFVLQRDVLLVYLVHLLEQVLDGVDLLSRVLVAHVGELAGLSLVEHGLQLVYHSGGGDHVSLLREIDFVFLHVYVC